MDSRELLSDYEASLNQLGAALAMPADNDVVKAGCIQYFEFTFELAWKTVKRIAQDEGINDCNSPKAALKVAFSNEWINEEDVWLDMLASRNKMSHTYSASAALKIFDKLPDYHSALKALQSRLAELLSRLPDS